MKKDKKKLYIFIICAAVLSLAVRLVMLNHFAQNGSLESFEYSEIAKNIVEGRGYAYDYLGTTYRSFATPGYAILISGIYLVFGIGIIPVIYLQILLSLGSCIAIFLIARRITNERFAALACLLSLFHPGLILYSVKKAHALNLDVLLFLLVVVSVLRVREKPSLKRGLVSGMIFGLATLSRPSILVFLPVSAIWLWRDKALAKKKLVIAVLAVTVFVLPSVWTLRNYIVHNELIFSSSCDTVVFWLGNNPNSTGTPHMNDGTSVLKSDRRLYSQLLRLDELEKRALFKRKSTEFVLDHPGRSAGLFLKKIYYFWWFSPVVGFSYPRSYILLYKLYYSIMLMLAVAGSALLLFGKAKNIRKNARLLLMFLVAVSLFQALYYVDGRHRWIVEPIMMIFSAVGAKGLAERAAKMSGNSIRRIT